MTHISKNPFLTIVSDTRFVETALVPLIFIQRHSSAGGVGSDGYIFREAAYKREAWELSTQSFHRRTCRDVHLLSRECSWTISNVGIIMKIPKFGDTHFRENAPRTRNLVTLL